jgi:hypothetical protein
VPRSIASVQNILNAARSRSAVSVQNARIAESVLSVRRDLSAPKALSARSMQRSLSVRSVQSIQRRVAKLQSVQSAEREATAHRTVVATIVVADLATRIDDLSQRIMVAQRTNIYG